MQGPDNKNLFLAIVVSLAILLAWFRSDDAKSEDPDGVPESAFSSSSHPRSSSAMVKRETKIFLHALTFLNRS